MTSISTVPREVTGPAAVAMLAVLTAPLSSLGGMWAAAAAWSSASVEVTMS